MSSNESIIIQTSFPFFRAVMRAPLQMHLPMSSLALTYEDEPKEKKVKLISSPLECVFILAGSHLMSGLSPKTKWFCFRNDEYQKMKI